MRRIHPVLASALAVILGVVLYVVPASAQGGDYEAALASGDLATLIPEPFADADMMSGRTFESTLGPPQVDTPDAATAREALTAIVETAGLTLADAATITGFLGDEQAAISFVASHIPGVAAADWFEPFYRVSLSRNYSDPVREIVPIGSKQVLRISDRASDRSDLLYAQGEILWQLSGDDDLGAGFLEGLETIDGPSLLADPGALVDGEPVAVIGTAEDPLSQIPSQIRGSDTTTQTFPVATVLDGIDPSNEADFLAADALRSLLDGVGGVDRATLISGQAIADDGGISILGLHVAGADQADFADGFIDLFVLSQFDDPQVEQTQLGGKDVARVSDAGSLRSQPMFAYGVGETIWILGGQEEYITALLRTMP